MRDADRVEARAQLADFLSKHAQVSWVSYPGLKTDKYHALQQKYSPKGAGAVLGFAVAAIIASFAIDIVWLFRHRQQVGAPQEGKA